MGKIKDAIDGVESEVEALARKLIGGPVDEVRDAVREGLTKSGLPLRAEVVEAIVDRIVASLEAHFRSVERLAKHVLGNDNAASE